MGKGGIRVNFLVNYGWEWDLNLLKSCDIKSKNIYDNIQSKDISRIDLLIRWGGRRRLSGFLPVQSVYSDIFIILLVTVRETRNSFRNPPVSSDSIDVNHQRDDEFF